MPAPNPFALQLDPHKGAWHLGRWRGVPVLAHWTLLLFLPWALLSSRGVVASLLASLAFIIVMLVHELGHAAIAHWRRVKVLEIDLLFLHGQCRHEAVEHEEDDVWIAWGGVLAQLVLCVTALVAWYVLARSMPVAAAWTWPFFRALTISNVFIACYNLLPICPLDGFKTWRAVPLVREWWKEKQAVQQWQRQKEFKRRELSDERARKEVQNILEKMRRGD